MDGEGTTGSPSCMHGESGIAAQLPMHVSALVTPAVVRGLLPFGGLMLPVMAELMQDRNLEPFFGNVTIWGTVVKPPLDDHIETFPKPQQDAIGGWAEIQGR